MISQPHSPTASPMGVESQDRPHDPQPDPAAPAFVDGPEAIPEPGRFIGKLEPNYYCRGWNSKRVKYCRARAGHSTAHPQQGRCSKHGGIARGDDRRIKHLERSSLVEGLPGLRTRFELKAGGQLVVLSSWRRGLVLRYVRKREEPIEMCISAEQLSAFRKAVMMPPKRRRRAAPDPAEGSPTDTEQGAA
jgi:hypothetical protein